MLHPQLIIDFDKKGKLAAIEFLDTIQLMTINPLLCPELFKKIKEVDIIISENQNYRVILLSFNINGKVIQEKLPLFAFDCYEENFAKI